MKQSCFIKKDTSEGCFMRATRSRGHSAEESLLDLFKREIIE